MPLDQRGLTRVVGSRVDIGATEWSQPVLLDESLSHAMPHGLGDSGVPVSYLLSGASDADSNVSLGIAIVGSDELRGVIQYSTDGGTTWQNVGSVSNASALLISGNSNNRVRLDPNSPLVDNVADAITFQAWDGSIGASGQKLDLSTTANAISFGSDTLAISMLPASNPGFVVNSTYTTGNQTQPAAATNAAGNSVIVWTGPGPSGTGVYAQLLAAGSNTAGTPILVATPTAGAAIQTPQVAIDSTGNFVVTWADTYGIYGRRFNANGTAQTDAFMVAVVLDPGSQHFQSPSVATDNNGNIVFVWVDAYSAILYSRTYQIDNIGDITANDPVALQTPTDTSGPDSWATVAAGPNGSYVIAWVDDNYNDPADIENNSVYLQQFDATGTVLSSPVLVSDSSDMWSLISGDTSLGPTSLLVNSLHVAVGADGDIVVAWNRNVSGWLQDNSDRSFSLTQTLVRHYNQLGFWNDPQTLATKGYIFNYSTATETALDSYPIGTVSDASVAIDGSGRYGVAWQPSDLSSGTSVSDVSVQWFGSDSQPLTDGNATNRQTRRLPGFRRVCP